MKARNPEFKERVRRYLTRQNFMHHMHFDLEKIEPGRTSGTLIVEEIHKQQKGLVHGGVIATLADIVAGFAAYTLVAEDQNVVTGEIKISYLRASKAEKLFAEGEVLKAGGKINFCESSIWAIDDDNKTLIAKATTSMVIV